MRDLIHGLLALHYLPFPLVESWAHLDDARRDANSNCERRNRLINDRALAVVAREHPNDVVDGLWCRSSGAFCDCAHVVCAFLKTRA